MDRQHRDKTRVQMPAKMFLHLKLIMLAVYGPHSWFWLKAKKQFFKSNLVFFLQEMQDSDNIIHS